MVIHDSKTEWSLSEAQQVFQSLVECQRLTALWFADPDGSFDISQPQSLRILDSIAQVCDRESWLLVRKLKAWHSRHSK